MNKTRLFKKMAVQMGLEPTISSVTGRHVNHYTTGPKYSIVNKNGGPDGTRTHDLLRDREAC